MGEEGVKGRDAYSAGKFEDAIHHLTLAINVLPTDHFLYSNRSAAYASLSQFNEALLDAKKTLMLKSDFVEGYIRLGDAYFGLAVLAYENCNELPRDWIEGYSRLGAAYIRLAVLSYEKGLENHHSTKSVFKNPLDDPRMRAECLISQVSTGPELFTVTQLKDKFFNVIVEIQKNMCILTGKDRVQILENLIKTDPLEEKHVGRHLEPDLELIDLELLEILAHDYKPPESESESESESERDLELTKIVAEDKALDDVDVGQHPKLAPEPNLQETEALDDVDVGQHPELAPEPNLQQTEVVADDNENKNCSQNCDATVTLEVAMMESLEQQYNEFDDLKNRLDNNFLDKLRQAYDSRDACYAMLDSMKKGVKNAEICFMLDLMYMNKLHTYQSGLERDPNNLELGGLEGRHTEKMDEAKDNLLDLGNYKLSWIGYGPMREIKKVIDNCRLLENLVVEKKSNTLDCERDGELEMVQKYHYESRMVILSKMSAVITENERLVDEIRALEELGRVLMKEMSVEKRRCLELRRFADECSIAGLDVAFKLNAEEGLRQECNERREEL